MKTPELESLLLEKFGYPEFLPGQRTAIELLLEGRSVATVFPTGGGKSLCYQLPSLLFEGLTLVVSPLIALMKDQIDALSKRGIAAARLDSTLDADGFREVMDAVRNQRLRLLYVAPERFNNERFRTSIQDISIACFAVDEAHCISEWGHSFRPDYLKLAEFARICGAERVLALTATATPEVLGDICRLFEIAPDCAVRTPFYRGNLTLLTQPVTPEKRDALLLERIQARAPGPTIVYVTLQRTAEEVAKLLQRAAIPARAYHAGLRDEVRSEVQDGFMASDEAVVVATIAFGMGIDKSNIRSVYHYNLPKSLENYAQEVGRAGRDGEPSVCEMLVCPEDLNTLENFAYGDTPSRQSVDQLVQFIFSEEEHFDVSLFELSALCDIRPLVLRTLLTYLELDGFLEGGTPFYSSYKFKTLVNSEEILAGFEGERREFLANVFQRAAPGRLWFSLDAAEVASELGCERDRIVRALDYLHEKNLLEVKAAGVRNRYRRRRVPDSLATLAENLFDRMVAREGREIERLQQVLAWTSAQGCLTSALGEHFGEPLEEPCGHCSGCLGSREPPRVREPSSVEVKESLWSDIENVRCQHPDVLGDARALARWLCGVGSPRLTRAKLTRHELYGALAHLSFEDVLRRSSAS